MSNHALSKYIRSRSDAPYLIPDDDAIARRIRRLRQRGAPHTPRESACQEIRRQQRKNEQCRQQPRRQQKSECVRQQPRGLSKRTTSADLRNGKSAVVGECAAGSWEGGSVWPPALELVQSLCCAGHSIDVEAATVLELGAGCGLVGIAAALRGARRVALTDLPVALPTLRSNLAANGLVEGEGGIEVGTLDWTASEQPLLESAGRSFDVVVASECLYDADMVLPLLRTAHRACAPNGTLLLSGIIGGEATRLFRVHVQRFFRVCEPLPPVDDPQREPPPISRATPSTVSVCASRSPSCWAAAEPACRESPS